MRFGRPAALGFAVLTALALAGSAQATFPGANGIVVFQSNRDGDFDLWAQERDGTGLHMLVARPGTNEFNPSWSPSGDELVFQSGPLDGSDFDLYLVAADGTGLTPLIVGATFDWAPQFCDEDTVVFQRNRTGGDIYAIETDGTGLRPLTQDAASDSFPTCRPDGSSVAFASTRGGVQGIYEVPLSSAQAGRAPLLATPTLLIRNALDADFSPEGDDLLFAGPDPTDRSAEIFSLDLDTKEVKQLTSSPTAIFNRLPKAFPQSDLAVAPRPSGEEDEADGDGDEGEQVIWTQIQGTSESVLSFAPPCPSVVRSAGALPAICFAAISRGSAAVIQPLPHCACDDLSVSIPKKGVGSAEGSPGGRRVTKFFFTFRWELRCTKGVGPACTGKLDVEPRRGFTVTETVRISKGGKKTRTDEPVTCAGSCSRSGPKTARGTIRVTLDSKKSLAQLAGTKFSVDVVSTCGGRTRTQVFTVTMSASGRIQGVSASVKQERPARPV